jgi:hypothetical protein
MPPDPLPFEDLHDFFTDCGEYGDLCDIHAVEAKSEAWAVFLAEVVPRYPHQFSYLTETGETSQPLPADPMEPLKLASSDEGPWPNLALEVAGLDIRILFHDPTWLEADFWRRDVTPERYAAVAELMHRMGDAMRHDIFLTGESRESEGVMVYEFEKRRFRRPRHGEGRDGALRDRIFAQYADALAPIRACADPSLPNDPLSDAALWEVLQSIESITAPLRELTMQDELTIQERRDLTQVWSTLATIVRPAPGSSAKEYRHQYWQDLLKRAQRIG